MKMRDLYPLNTVSVGQKKNIYSIHTPENRRNVWVLWVIVTKVVTLIHPSFLVWHLMMGLELFLDRGNVLHAFGDGNIRSFVIYSDST